MAGSAVHFILALLLLLRHLRRIGRSKPARAGEALTAWQGPGSPASAAGIEPGDVIISINGHAVHSLDQVSAITSVSAGRRKLTIVVRRDGHLKTLTLVPVERPRRVVRRCAGGCRIDRSTPVLSVSSSVTRCRRYLLCFRPSGVRVTEVGSIMKEAVAAVWDRFSPAGIANLSTR